MVNLSWTASANAAYYNVKRSTSASGPFVTVTSPTNGDKTTTTTYTDYNVMNIATDYSNIYPFTSNRGPVTRFGPSIPTSLIATLTQNSITLNWSYVLSGDPASIPNNCEIYYKQNSGLWKLFTTVDYPTNTATYTGASPNTNYQFCVRAIVNYPSSGINYNSRFSPIVSATTPSDPCFGVQGADSGLKGTVFGLTPSWASGSEYCKATDGNTSTFYDYTQANGGYTGLDLGTAKVIGKIWYYPRSTFASRMTGGKFQGSNISNSSGFVDLYTITATPAEKWNMVDISNSTAYRWVRYLSPTGGYCNIAEMEFYPPPSQSPAYNGPHNIANSVTLQVEDFDNGGEEVAYHDNDASNSGGQYRTNEGVDIENGTTGVTNVGWTNAGEWMKYTCNVTAGTYNITLYAASPNSGTQQVKLYQDNTLKAIFTVPNTGGWQTYQAITVNGVSLASNSVSVFKIESTNGGYNLDKVVFTAASTDPCSGVQGGGSGLNGTTFGLDPPYAAGSEYCKATDGNINTYYDYSQANGGYTGLDLGSAKVITKIRYYPRANWASLMTGGKFQGSNTSNNSRFVDLYTISGTPAAQWNEVTISNSTGYRWIRYLSPDNGFGNIAEMECYESSTTFPDPTKWYKLTNANSGKVLQPRNGTANQGDTMVQMPYSGATSQMWKFVSLGNGLYNIVNKNSGYYMDIYGAQTSAGVANINWAANGGRNQNWSLIDVGNSSYNIQNQNSGLYLDITGASWADGAEDIQWTPNGGNNQKWLITEVQ